jgi:hypothetical protein
MTFQKTNPKRRSVKDEIPENIDRDEFLLASEIFNCEDNPLVC